MNRIYFFFLADTEKVLYSKNSSCVHSPVNHLGDAHKEPIKLWFENWQKTFSVCMFLTAFRLHGFNKSRKIQPKIP